MANKAEHKGIYIDPLTDFGFKRLFGDQDLMDVCTQILAEISTIAGGHA